MSTPGGQVFVEGTPGTIVVEDTDTNIVQIIAQGPQGIQGSQGIQGPQGIQGVQGIPGPAGTGGFAVSLSGNTSGALALISTGTAIFAGGPNITLSQNGQSITISGGAGGAGGIALSAAGQSVSSGTVTLSNSNNVSFGMAGSVVTATATFADIAQSIGVSNIGNTSGNTGTYSGQVVFAGGNNITLSVSSGAGGAQTVTISGPNAGGAQTGISSIIVSNTTYTSGAVSFSNANGITFGSSAGQAITASYNSTQFAGTGTSITGNASITLNSNGIAFNGSGLAGTSTGATNISVTLNSSGIAISGPTETGVGLSAAGQQATAGVLTLSNSNNVSFGMAASVITATATFAQSNQTLSLAATSNTAGNTSGMSVDARSLTLAGYGIASVGYSTSAGGSSIVISASQTVQTQNLVDVSLSGNTAGALALVSSGTLILAGGNNITLSQNGQSVTISGPNAGGAQTGISSIVAAGGTQTVGEVSFINSNNVSFGMSTGANTGSITASYALNVSAGAGTSNALSGITFLNSNSITFGLSTGAGVGSITATVSYPAQTNQTLSLAATSNTAGNTSGMSVDARSLTLAGYGNASVGFSTSAGGSSIVISVTTAAQTNQQMTLFATSNTTQSSTGTTNASSLIFAGAGGVSVGITNGSIVISGAAAGGAAQSIGVSTGGNTAGNTGTYSGQVIFAGGNNITLSVSSAAAGAQTITISGPNTVAQTNQTLGAYATGANTTAQSSSTTFDARSLSISGAGIVSAGMSTTAAGAPVLVISATTAAQTNQTLSWAATSNTTGNTSGMTVDARSLTIGGYGNVSVGLSTSAGGSTLVISGATAAGLTTGGFYALGNTTQNSSTTLPLTAMSFNGLGAMTVGYSNSSIQLSAPATSSLVGVNGISVSTNGSTISISGQGYTQKWFAPELYGNTLTTSHANGTLYLRPFELDGAMSIVQDIFQQSFVSISSTISISASVSAGNASSGTATWGQTGTVLLFSRLNTNNTNASFNSIQTFNSNSYTLSAGYSLSVSWSTNASSATASWTTSAAVGYINNIGSNGAVTTTAQTQSGSSTFSSTSTNANSFSSSYGMSFVHPFLSGVRPLFVPSVGATVAAGEYYIGMIQSTTTGTTNYAELSRLMVSAGPGMLYFTATSNNYLEIGNSVALTTSNWRNGFGSYSSSGNTTTAIALSQVSQMASNASLYFALDGYTK